MATKQCCRNEGKLILRAFVARSPDGSTDLFRCYLLGGDTAAPSGLYARLCHAFMFWFLNHAHRSHQWTDFDDLYVVPY